MNYEMVNTEAVLVTHQHGGKGNPITRDVLEGQTNLVLHSSLGVTEPNLSTAVDKLWEGKGYLLHKVEVTDTLWGLSIRYNVSADQIRRANNMSTDDIYFLKELIIPNPQTNLEMKYDPDDVNKIRRKQMMEIFLGYVKSKDKTESFALFYLDENDWNLIKALRNYEDDEKFEEENAKSGKEPLLMKKLR